MKVLAVEDDDVSRAILVRSLERLGHEVTVHDGVGELGVDGHRLATVTKRR